MAPIAQRVFKSPTRAVDLAAAADEAPHAVALQRAWGAWRAEGVRRGGCSGGQVPPPDPHSSPSPLHAAPRQRHVRAPQRRTQADALAVEPAAAHLCVGRRASIGGMGGGR